MLTQYLIRPLYSIAEFHDCEALQHRVWRMEDDLEVVPMHMLLTVANQGGVLLGAFDGEELVGFVFGFPGLTPDGQLKHCSHMLGVHPNYQSSGIGRQLKVAQRTAVLEQGLDLVTWTYDPLESRNAHLNIGKLGAVCQTYVEDLYGPLDDGLNTGLPTDRLQVDWWLATDWVEQRLGGAKEMPESGPFVEAIRAEWNAGSYPAPGDLHLGPTNARAITIEVPSDYQAIKAADAALALEWRLAAREVFQAYFDQEYVVADFASLKEDGRRRSFYTLRRTSPVDQASSAASS